MTLKDDMKEISTRQSMPYDMFTKYLKFEFIYGVGLL